MIDKNTPHTEIKAHILELKEELNQLTMDLNKTKQDLEDTEHLLAGIALTTEEIKAQYQEELDRFARTCKDEIYIVVNPNDTENLRFTGFFHIDKEITEWSDVTRSGIRCGGARS